MQFIASIGRIFCLAVLSVSLAGCANSTASKSEVAKSEAAKAEAQLIPRRILFGNPEREGVRISPDGKYISHLAPVDGVMNVWVAPASDPAAASAITHDRKRGIRQYFWAFGGQQIIYTQDEAGEENWNVFAVDVKSREVKNLTPQKHVNARINEVSERQPDEILVDLNDRDPRFHDVHRINLRSGHDTLVLENPGMIDGHPVEGIVCDDDYRVRFAIAATADGGRAVYQPAEPVKAGQKPQWNLADQIPMDDALGTSPLAFDKTGKVLYATDSRGRDTAALVAINVETRDKQVLAADDQADAGPPLIHPTEKTVQAVPFNYRRQQWKVIDPSVEADFSYLKSVAGGRLVVGSRTLDDKTWIVAYISDTGPVRYYRYDRAAKKAMFLFTNQPALEKWKLAPMHDVVIKSRDGLDLVSYLTLPLEVAAVSAQAGTSNLQGGGPAAPARPLPMVLLVHGGPWGRDAWGLNTMHQWLANRGYAVLSVNFRGSTGFGKKFVNAGNREWGGKMHDDLIDAVHWAISSGYADKGKIAIMGGSYGGYATLAGLTLTPDTFACGVDIVGPSRITTLLKTIPPYWTSGLAMFKARVGDFSTSEGAKFLDSRSPLMYAERIKKPLLIGQGKNDPRVKQAEADQIVQAMQAHRLPVTYVIYSDEGHGFQRPENMLSFQAVSEQFLAQHLGGKAEPIGEDFKGSSIAVPAGADQIPGLMEALKGITHHGDNPGN